MESVIYGQSSPKISRMLLAINFALICIQLMKKSRINKLTSADESRISKANTRN